MGMTFLSCSPLVMGETFLLWCYYYMGITFHLCFHRNHLPFMVPLYAFPFISPMPIVSHYGASPDAHLSFYILTPLWHHFIYSFMFLTYCDSCFFGSTHCHMTPPILIMVILLLWHRFIHSFLTWFPSLLCCPSCRTWSVHTFTSFHVLPLKYFHGLCAHCMYV